MMFEALEPRKETKNLCYLQEEEYSQDNTFSSLVKKNYFEYENITAISKVI